MLSSSSEEFFRLASIQIANNIVVLFLIYDKPDYSTFSYEKFSHICFGNYCACESLSTLNNFIKCNIKPALVVINRNFLSLTKKISLF